MMRALANKLVLVAGLRGARVGDPGELIEVLRSLKELKGLAFQLLDARLVAGPEHLFSAAFNAIRAFELGINVASDLGLEILTFASGQRQISKAIKTMGLKPGSSEVAVVLVGESRERLELALKAIIGLLGAQRDDRVLEVDEQKARELADAFGITSDELASCSRLGSSAEAVKALVLERVALSVAYR